MINQLKGVQGKFKNGQMDKASYVRRMHDIHKIFWEYMDFIGDKNISSIKISKDRLTFTTEDGIVMMCGPGDRRSVPLEILNFGDYEPAELRMMGNFIKKDSVIIDIGANIGWYSLNLARRVPDGCIIAFEPIPGTFEYLKKNIAVNKITNIKALNFGLSDRAGTLGFYYDPKFTVAASLRNLHGNSKRKKVLCRVRRLDDFILTMTPRIDFIKCDVEGAELFVIKGALEVLKKTKPVMLLEMLRKWSVKFGYHPNEIIDLLEGIGYGCYYVKHDKLVKIAKVNERTKATNFYFLDPVKHARFLKELS